MKVYSINRGYYDKYSVFKCNQTEYTYRKEKYLTKVDQILNNKKPISAKEYKEYAKQINSGKMHLKAELIDKCTTNIYKDFAMIYARYDLHDDDFEDVANEAFYKISIFVQGAKSIPSGLGILRRSILLNFSYTTINKYFKHKKRFICEECLPDNKFLEEHEKVYTIDEQLENNELNSILKKYVSKLKKDRPKILTLRYGLDDGVDKSLNCTGKLLNKSKFNVDMIQQKSIKKLKELYQSEMSKDLENMIY